MESELRQKITYYGRNGYYQTMHVYSTEAFKRNPNDLSFRLLSGYGLLLLGRFQDSIRELDNLHTAKDVNVGATLALIFAHKHCQTVDKDTVALLEEKLKSERKLSDGVGLYYAALLFFLQNRIDKSKEYLNKFLKNNNDYLDGLCLKGWLELASDNKNNLKAAASCFKIVLEKDRKHLDALLGLVKVKELQKEPTESLSFLNQYIVKNISSVPPLLEKSKILLSIREWDQALETSNRVLAHENSSIDAHKVKIITTLCREGNNSEGAIHLKKLFSEMDKYESKNAAIYMNTAQLFSSIACRQQDILRETIVFAEKAAQLDPGNADFIAELGFQYLMQGNTKEASRCFKNTTKLDDSAIIGLTGLTWCQILGGNVNEQTKQQVDFLREVQSDHPTAELLLMSASLAVDPHQARQALQQAAHIQLTLVQDLPYGISYIQKLNVDLLMQIVKANMNWALGALNSNDSNEFYKNCLVILSAIHFACPGLKEPQLELARTHYLLGNMTEAKDVLTHILDTMDASLADAHVLMAQINLKQKNYVLAARSLENSLSHNFQIRDHPLYHLAAAMVHKQNENSSEVIKSLKIAMASPAYGSNDKDGVLALSQSDRATICLELIEALAATQQLDKADELMKKSLQQFKDTKEEGQILVANAQLMVDRGNVKAAIESLQKIQPEESHYMLARRGLGDIYLKHLHNREMYAQCYQDLVRVAPSKDAYEMLGDAYTSIQDPDGAISAYEEALKYDENNSYLICKMGKSLVKTHYFTKAINYYKEAVKNNDDPQLLYDMAQLYFKLGQLDNAERIVMKHVNDKKIDSSDVKQLTLRTSLLQLLAKVRDKSGSLTDSLAALKEAKENHCRMDKRALSQSDAHKAVVVDICNDTAQLLTRLRDFSGAIKICKEALNYRPNDPKVLVTLAKLYMQINSMDECQETCQHLLSIDGDSEPAAIMLADIAFRKMDLDTSAHHLKQLLSRQSSYWSALARLIEVARRLGRLEDASPFMARAEEHSARTTLEAGLYYCKGLYDRYSGQPQQALQFFNYSRGDPEWGELATHNMIDICLNPDHDIIGGEEFYYEMLDDELPDAKENALKTAKRLLMLVKPRKGSEEEMTHRILNNYFLLATRQKASIETALQDLIQITNDNFYKEHVGVALAIATAFMLQKQVQKAKNYLKRMVKTQWRFEDAEYLERSWLLLTDIQIQAGKTDLAADLIQRVLEHNKSCYKAYEYAGYIAEKEQLYKEAAFQYDQAWRYSGQSNPAIGFKLAFNYMKAKQYADAIDICHAVLKLNPNYPRIRKEILEKSRNHLRT